MPISVDQALAITPASRAHERTVDITTTGARTGRSRRLEMWFYRVADEIYLTTPPARRDWYANIVQNRAFTFHLKHGVRADLQAQGTPVIDPSHRRQVFEGIIADLNQDWNPAGIAQPVAPLSAWLAGSPLVHVTSTDENPS